MKALKYLPEYGWQPDIVSAENDDAFGRDVSLLADEPPGWTVLRVPPMRGIPGRLLRRFRVPDHLSVWIPAASAAALRLAQRVRYDALLSLSFPASSHVAALLVHSLTGLPWLADFSDPWTNNPYRSGPLTWRERLSGRLERRVIVAASTIGFASPELRDYEIRFHREIAGKVLVTPNPAESQDFLRSRQIRKRDDRFTLVHTGSFYSIRQPRYLFEAFSRFRTRHPEAGAELRLVGSWSDAPLSRETRSDHVEGVVRVGPRSHEEALREMVGADVLVIVDPSEVEPGIFMPLKLSEYLMAGPPILALTVPGPVTRFVERFRAGKAVRFDDVPAIELALEQLYASSHAEIEHNTRAVPELEARAVGWSLAEALGRIAPSP